MLFFGTAPSIARYESVNYPAIERLTNKQLGFFWRPEEVDLTRDASDFKRLSLQEQHIFTSNIKRQIVLDTVQGRAPSLALLPLASEPELEAFIQTWTFFETIHSRSYTHIIRAIYSNPTAVLDTVLNSCEIVACQRDINYFYDQLIRANASGQFGDYEHKKKLWLCLNAINALEGVRFYVSFACAWNFAEQKLMEGNAKIIRLIARDENLHLAFTQQLLKILVSDDRDFAKIQSESREEVIKIFEDVATQEKAWALYLFRDGSMLGLNERLLCQYIDWITGKRLSAIGYARKEWPATIDPPTSNPLPWTQAWISSHDVQVAPQEVVITSYVIGDVISDLDDNTFRSIEL